MRFWFTAAIVVALVLCILVIVVSPYVDLPLTTVRTCIAALFLMQALLLDGMLREPSLSSLPLRGSFMVREQSACGPPTPLLPLLCSYLC